MVEYIWSKFCGSVLLTCKMNAADFLFFTVLWSVVEKQ